MSTSEGGVSVERKVFACKRCERDVMWATAMKGQLILLDAEPSPWEPGVFAFTDKGKVVRAQRGTRNETFRCHWGDCHE